MLAECSFDVHEGKLQKTLRPRAQPLASANPSASADPEGSGFCSTEMLSHMSEWRTQLLLQLMCPGGLRRASPCLASSHEASAGEAALVRFDWDEWYSREVLRRPIDIARCGTAMPQPIGAVEDEGTRGLCCECPVGDGGAPAAYLEVLRLLREIVSQGRWPATSVARAEVIERGISRNAVPTAAEGCSGAPAAGCAGGAAELRHPKSDADESESDSEVDAHVHVEAEAEPEVALVSDGESRTGGSFALGVVANGMEAHANSRFPDLLRAAFEVPRLWLGCLRHSFARCRPIQRVPSWFSDRRPRGANPYRPQVVRSATFGLSSLTTRTQWSGWAARCLRSSNSS